MSLIEAFRLIQVSVIVLMRNVEFMEEEGKKSGKPRTVQERMEKREY